MNEEIVNCFNIVIEVVKGVALYVMPIAAFIVSLIALKRSNDTMKVQVQLSEVEEKLKEYELALEAASGMEDFHEKMISTNDELVEKYGLPKKFIWKE